ncbi:MAG: Kazal-type serine protease inhibitor family protein [Flavobacteriales bacterium]
MTPRKSNRLLPSSLITALIGILGFILPAGAQVTTSVDCDLHGLVCNVCSQPDIISIYHPGPYLTWPPATNVLEWEFTDSQGNVLHEATLVDETTVTFSFDLPLTDTLFVSVLHTNDSVFHNGNPYPWACLVEDYLIWEETEIIPGTFQGSWTLGGSSGVDVSEPATCVDPDLIDPSAVCPEIFEPVCGCDGMTYSNACEATNTGGVTSWEDGPCIVIEYGGCTYPQACNYDPGAGFEDGSCIFPPESCSWPDSWAAGCTYAEADNYDPSAIVDDGSCSWPSCANCPADINGDDAVTVSDVLALLGAFGTTCSEPPFSLIGRWHPEGFESNTLYEFTEDFRYTIYSADGTFGSIEDGTLTPNPWHMEGDTVVIDLHFGNELRGLLEPSCGGQKATITQATGMQSVLIREGVDPADCE